MFLVGLTGGIATGKSLVSNFFKENGIPLIDADQIAKQVVEPGEPALAQIKENFGNSVIKDCGELDRDKLGDEIFSDIEKKKLLNKITHPYIYGEIRKQVLKYLIAGEPFVVLDLPLLFETRSVSSYLHKTIVVTCDADIQIDRLMKRNSFSKDEALKRIESQLPLDEKVSLADFVVENSGSITNTRSQFEDILKMLKSSNQHIVNRILIVVGLLLIFFIFVLILRFIF